MIWTTVSSLTYYNLFKIGSFPLRVNSSGYLRRQIQILNFRLIFKPHTTVSICYSFPTDRISAFNVSASPHRYLFVSWLYLFILFVYIHLSTTVFSRCKQKNLQPLTVYENIQYYSFYSATSSFFVRPLTWLLLNEIALLRRFFDVPPSSLARSLTSASSCMLSGHWHFFFSSNLSARVFLSFAPFSWSLTLQGGS